MYQEVFEVYSQHPSVRYLGEGYTVRGIPARLWRAEGVDFPAPSGTRTFRTDIEWYFAAPGWRWDHDTPDVVPLQIVARGVESTPGATAGAAAFHNVYNFVEWVPGAPDPRLFRVPDWCTATDPSKLPPIAESFSATIECSFAHRNATLRVREWRDAPNQRRFG